MSPYDHPPALVELYLDFAAHLLSIPETHEIPGAVEWLAERILTGSLPDCAAYQARPVASFSQSPVAMHSVLTSFMHPDSDHNSELGFMNAMEAAAHHLRHRGLPPFPRESELTAPHEE